MIFQRYVVSNTFLFPAAELHEESEGATAGLMVVGARGDSPTAYLPPPLLTQHRTEHREEAEVERTGQEAREDRRRRRRDRQSRAAGDEIEEVEVGAGSLVEGVVRELQRGESREERRERKKKKKLAKRRKRLNADAIGMTDFVVLSLQ